MIRATAEGVELDVLIAPRASRNKIGNVHDNRLKIAVTAAPVDGAANSAVIELLAKALRVPKSSVTLLRGQTAKRKTLLVRGIDSELARERLPGGGETA